MSVFFGGESEGRLRSKSASGVFFIDLVDDGLILCRLIVDRPFNTKVRHSFACIQRPDDLRQPNQSRCFFLQTLMEYDPIWHTSAAEDADCFDQQFSAPSSDLEPAARQSVIDALPLLPAELTADYREASEAAPDLIMGETDPAIFFRCEKGNPWAAAKRLVLHWTLRREVFGEERWLRKMVDLSGEGAMNADDIALLHTGVFALTSSSPSSSLMSNAESTQQALLVNFSRLNGRDPGPSRHRVFMFLMYFLNVFTQENGLIVLMSLPGSGVRVRSDNGKMLKESYRSQLFWVKQIYLIHDPNDGRQMLVRTFAAMIASLVRRVLDRVPQMIVSSDRSSARSLLQMHSVDPQLVPEHLGGYWSYRHFDIWLDRLFRQHEVTTGLGAPWDTNSDTSRNRLDSAPVIGTSLIFQASRDIQDATPRQLPAHVVKLRKGESAKNRYQKRKRDVENLQNHEQELRRQNAALQSESARLEVLVDLALNLIQNLD